MAVQKIAPVRIRGARTVAPPGYIVGRTGSESGELQLISIADLGANMQKIGAVPKVQTFHPRLGITAVGPFTASQQFLAAAAPVPVTFPSLSAASFAQCDFAPHGNVTFYLCSNLSAFLASGAPAGVLATITFSAGMTTGTITYIAQVLAVNATLTLVMPAVADATFAGVRLTFAGDQ